MSNDAMPTAVQAQLGALLENLQQPTEQETSIPPVEEAGNDTSAQNQQPTPQAEPQPEPKTEPEQFTPTDASRAMAEDGDWKRKHDAMFGKLSGEIGSLRKELQERQTEAERLRRELEQRASHPETASESTASTTPIPLQQVSEEEVRKTIAPNLVEEFGVDFWQQQIALQRVTQAGAPKAESAPNHSEERQRIEALETTLEEQARQRFFAELNTRVPNWKEVNDSKGWNVFLGGIEPLTGLTFEYILRNAYAQHDVARVARLFEQFAAQSPSEENAIASQATLPGQSPGSNPEQTKTTMSFEEWEARMRRTTSSGLSPMQMADEQKKLLTMYEEGCVTGIDGKGGPPPPSRWDV